MLRSIYVRTQNNVRALHVLDLVYSEPLRIEDGPGLFNDRVDELAREPDAPEIVNVYEVPRLLAAVVTAKHTGLGPIVLDVFGLQLRQLPPS